MRTIAQAMITAFVTLTFCLGSGWAGEVTGLTSFVENTPAYATEVNDNFNAVAAEVNDNNTRINTNTTNINANDLAISTNAANIANNTTQIDTNTTNITTNTNTLTAAVNQINVNTAGINANAALIAGMPGITGAEGDPPYVTQTPIILLDQTITAPTDGYVLAIFGGIVYFQNHTNGTYQRMRMWLNLDGSANSYGQSFRFFEVRGDWATGAYYQNASSFTIIPVTAGDTTVYAVGDSSEPDGLTNTFFYNCNLYLLFIPNFY